MRAAPAAREAPSRPPARDRHGRSRRVARGARHRAPTRCPFPPRTARSRQPQPAQCCSVPGGAESAQPGRQEAPGPLLSPAGGSCGQGPDGSGRREFRQELAGRGERLERCGAAPARRRGREPPVTGHRSPVPGLRAWLARQRAPGDSVVGGAERGGVCRPPWPGDAGSEGLRLGSSWRVFGVRGAEEEGVQVPSPCR